MLLLHLIIVVSFAYVFLRMIKTRKYNTLVGEINSEEQPKRFWALAGAIGMFAALNVIAIFVDVK